MLSELPKPSRMESETDEKGMIHVDEREERMEKQKVS